MAGKSRTGRSGEPPRPAPPPAAASPWSQKYGQKHRLHWVRDFPQGIIAPRRVRIYRRAGRFILQWWDPAARRNLSDRVDGDLVSAIGRAREIEDRLDHFRSAGLGARRLTHAELVDRFLADLARRADAGAVEPRTVGRYRAALAHYLAYCAEPAVRKAVPPAAGMNREFRLGFAAFLANRSVGPHGRGRPMTGQGFVLDTVRALLEWAADPDRGNLLPAGFRNPFLRRGEPRPVFRGDPLGEPDVSLPMAVTLIGACDRYQLRLFAPLLLFGLRAAEPCYLFREFLDRDWLRVPCIPDLAYRTKGRRDKRFPLIEELRPLWAALGEGGHAGLLYRRRGVEEGRAAAPLCGHSLEGLVQEFRRRCNAAAAPDAAGRQRLRDAVLHDAGGLRYGHIEQEFRTLARRLGWPAAATLKDLRHLFATGMANAGLPEPYRRFLLGHAPGRAAAVAYTHLNQVREHYAAAVRREWTPLVDAIIARLTGRH